MKKISILFFLACSVCAAQDVKISAMPDASNLTGAYIPIIQGGLNKKASSSLFFPSAGGDLTGTYPNPNIAAGAVTNSKIANSTIDPVAKISGWPSNSAGALTNNGSGVLSWVSYTTQSYADAHLKGLTFTNSPSSGNVPTHNGTNWTFQSPVVYTASDYGITKVGNDFRLGGTVNNAVTTTVNESLAYSVDNDGFSTNGAFTLTNPANSSTINFLGDNTYLSYGANYTFANPETIITKRYADDHLKGLTFTNSPSSGFAPVYNGTNWTFQTVGTVTSVGITNGTNISHSGGPITSSGNITINAIPSGSTSQLQFNSSGQFAGNSNFTVETGTPAIDVGDFAGSEYLNITKGYIYKYSITNHDPFTLTSQQGDLQFGYAGDLKFLSSISTDNSQTHILTRDNSTGAIRLRDASTIGSFTLTTTGTSGAATFSGGVLNIPNYATGGSVAGSNTQIQYNNSGSFGASSNFTFNSGSTVMTLGSSGSLDGSSNALTISASAHLNLTCSSASTFSFNGGLSLATTTGTLALSSTSGGNVSITVSGGSNLFLSGLPTSSSGLASGAVWNNSGVLTIVP